MKISRILFSSIFVVLMAMVMTGCSSSPIVTTTTRTVYKHPEVPEKLFETPKPEKPMPDEEFLALSEPEQMTELRRYTQVVLKALKASHNNVKAIKKVLDDAKKAADNESKSRD